MHYAHSYGIVHRDLKPGNVWLTEDGTAKLGDFGLAMAVDKTRLSAAGMIVGTLAYMPPEQALGRQPDARSDLYSLGAMLYEMTTGRPPFLGDDTVAVIGQHINTPPVAPVVAQPADPAGPGGVDPAAAGEGPGAAAQDVTTVRRELQAIADGCSDDLGGSAGRHFGRGPQSAGSAGRRRVRRPRTGTGCSAHRS